MKEKTKMKDILYPLRRAHGTLHNIKMSIETHWLSQLSPQGKKFFLLGTPTHTNIGDSAIAVAEQFFLKRVAGDPQRVKELTLEETKADASIVFHCIRLSKRHVVCWHGGGNLGDQWFVEERFRRQAIERLPHNPMVLFPQTIYYTPTEIGKAEEKASIVYYNGHQGLTMVAREQQSYNKMKQLYPETEILLVPDIVLSCTMDDFAVTSRQRKGAMLCIRNDAEKVIEGAVWEVLQEMLESKGVHCRITDMHAAAAVTKETRFEIVRGKMEEFCTAQLVITDRLHGMVFAAITGTPCVVFSNYNHKVKGTYEWIKYLPYIRYVETVDEAKACIPELLDMKECRYDNTPLKPYFEKLAEVVKEKCH